MTRLNAWLLVLIIALYGFFLLNNLSTFTTPYDAAYWSQVFSHSQLVKGDKAAVFLSDSEVYAIVGYKYARGEDPTKIHAEVPPLGKYLIGVSIILFGNPVAILPVVGVLVLLLLYLFSLRVLEDKIAAIIVTGLFSLDPLFREHILTSTVELPHLLFLLASLIFFLKGLNRPGYFLLASASLGAMMASKIYISGLALLAILVSFLSATWQVESLVFFFLSLVALPISYSAAYAVHLIRNPDLLAFAQFQRWLAIWWAGSPQVPWGGVFKILLTGRWQTWWSNREVISFESWTPVWPLTTTASLVGALLALARREKKVLLVVFWVAGYLLFLAPAATFPRHLLAVLPGLYLLLVYAIMKGYGQAQEIIFKKGR